MLIRPSIDQNRYMFDGDISAVRRKNNKQLPKRPFSVLNRKKGAILVQLWWCVRFACFFFVFFFDWWNRSLVDINAMIQLTVVKIFALSFIIHMSLFWNSQSLSLKFRTDETFSGRLLMLRIHLSHICFGIDITRAYTHYTSKIETRKLSPFEKK